uniref:Coiled-coil domain containing 60 n=1 Tax=Leptobrachium leishanense TaxID=445787 RepID=A0A8C5LPK7_9ANUR
MNLLLGVWISLETKPEESACVADTEEETQCDISSKILRSKDPESSVTSQYLKHRKKDANCFNKTMQHTKQLVNNVRQGRGYFYLLHSEEESKKREQEAKLYLQQEKLRTEPQPFRDSADESSGDEESEHEHTDKARLFITEVAEQQEKKKTVRRPFTPIHNSLFGAEIFNENPESLFRQLCALHWLLESLISEPSTNIRPVSACWNVRDPGGSKTSLKRINREKEIEVKWEQFIMPGKGRKAGEKGFRGHIQRPRKASFLSVSRFSVLSSTHTPSMGSVSSLLPNSEETSAGGATASDTLQEGVEDAESTANSSLLNQVKQSKDEEEEPLSDYMQKLLDMITENVSKELDDEESQNKQRLTRFPSASVIKETFAGEVQGSNKCLKQRPKSSPASSLSSTSVFIKKKLDGLTEMRKMFFEVADEADMHMHDQVEAIERRRHEFSIQKYWSLGTVSHFHQDLEKMRNSYRHMKEEKDYTDTSNWFVMLLSKISPVMKKNSKLQKILCKLEKLEEKRFIRIRTTTFLKVLGGLHIWELCSPEISVAVQFVREYLVQMPLKEYSTWLQTHLTSSRNRAKSAPPIR